MHFSRDLGERYSPLYFFNAFAAGGLALSFFMYLLWTARCLYSSVPSFDILMPMVVDTSLFTSFVSLIGLAGFLFFTILHTLLLRWNIQSFKRWQLTVPYKTFEKSADKTVLLAIPMTLSLTLLLLVLTLSMALPFIFTILEPLLGLALVILSVLGVRALKIYIVFFLHLITQPSHDEAYGNNLGQIIAMLAFSMLGLAFAILSACSTIKITLVLGFLLATFFLTLTAFIALFWFGPRLSSLTERKISPESSPLFLAATGIVCLNGVTFHYLGRTLLSAFGSNVDAGDFVLTFGYLFAANLLLGTIGYILVKSHGFWARLLRGEVYAAGLYALVCPCLALLIFGQYFLNVGLTQSDIIEPWGLFYWLLSLPLIFAQLYIIRLFFRLNAKLFPAQARRK